MKPYKKEIKKEKMSKSVIAENLVKGQKREKNKKDK